MAMPASRIPLMPHSPAITLPVPPLQTCKLITPFPMNGYNPHLLYLATPSLLK